MGDGSGPVSVPMSLRVALCVFGGLPEWETEGSSSGGADEHPGKVPRMASDKAAVAPFQRANKADRLNTNGADRESCMGLILLEALLALVVLALIVWWTMFSGRDKGELPPSDKREP
jgi:hypothetical protein